MDNKVNKNDSMDRYRAQQFQDQRQQERQPSGMRPPSRPTQPGQQPGPGPLRLPVRPTPPAQGPVSPPSSGQLPPGMSAPRSAPPDFVPAEPFTERGVGRAPAQFRERFRGDMRTRPRDFNRCLNSFTYLWLVNGNNFWFFPIFVDRQFVIGFRWRRNRWEFDRINLNRILFFVCY